MSEWEDKILTLPDIARIYQEKAGEWLLLEVLEVNANQTPVKLRLIRHSPRKEDLHEHMMELEEEWDWERQYLIVLADPFKPCTISLEDDLPEAETEKRET
ncbi:MAG: hypothetical protein D6681_14770 [Calditrichaeota bacterium]|nr:MAG: hypothetical protein D6681_14770 [Calditrichota bacterium]